MSYEPIPFTNPQCELFARVCVLNRSRPNDFAEADQWLQSLADTGRAACLHFRSCCLAESRQRRRRNDRAWGIDLIRHEDGHGIVCCDRSTWQQLPQDQRQQWLRDARTLHGRNLRWQRRRLMQRRGKLQPHDIIGLAARQVLDDPPVFDAMNTQQRRLWAHRLLRLIWIMTDTEDLMTTQLSWLQAWQWGIDTLEFLSGLPDDPARPVPRLWTRMTILDRHIEQWQRLAGQALQVIEPAGPMKPADAKPARSKPDRTLSTEARAVATLMEHPDWTDEQIAKAAGCSRRSLYRMPRFVQARDAIRSGSNRMPRGFANGRTGSLEACSEPPDEL